MEKICPLSQKPCIGTDCSWWFQELSPADLSPVMNQCGCAALMTASYLMEIRPDISEIPRERIDICHYGEIINEKLGRVSDYSRDANANLLDVFKRRKRPR